MTISPFAQQLIVTVFDKVAIGGLLLIGGFWLNRLLERFKAERTRDNERERLRAQKHLDYLDRQLSEFYYPIYIRLFIDGATWERLLDRNRGDDELRKRIGEEIEKSIILPNHEAIVGIMQSKIHLAEDDGAAFAAILKYIRHVSVYRAMRSAGCYDRDPIALNEPWPDDLLPIIERTTYALQKRYDALIEPATTMA